MKILSVVFSNINSLSGTTSIDFTDPGFNSGVFLITGPTGSGKTTILDAITLALFGRTGRQRSITSGSDGANEAMTRDAGFCSSEVDFIGADGLRYRAAWSQTRARQKAGGRLQTVRRSLLALDGGERDISEHRATETAALIVEKLGFSFEEFTRTVILEQGQFDSFLKAKETERGDILEKATRTTRFSAAGRAIFAAYQRADRACEEAEQAYDLLGKTILGNEDLEEISRRIEALRREKSRLAVEEDGLMELGHWLADDRRLREEGEALRSERVVLEASEEEAGRRLASYERAKTARGADVPHAEACAAEREAQELRADLGRRVEAVSAMAEKIPALRTEAMKAAEAVEAARSAKAAAEPAIARARELDLSIREGRNAVAAAERALASSRLRLKKNREERSALADRIGRAGRLVDFATGYRARLLPVPAEFAGEAVVRAIDAWRDGCAALREQESALASLEQIARESEARFASAEAGWPAMAELLDACVERAEQVVRQALTLASLSEHRAHLVEGEPCPLCGATEHPYASPGVHLEATDEANEKLEAAKAKRLSERKKHDLFRDAAQRDRRRHDRARIEVETARTGLSRAEGAVDSELGIIRVSLASLASERERIEGLLADAEAEEKRLTAEARAVAEPLPGLEEERKGIPFADPDREAVRLQRGLDEKNARQVEADRLRSSAGQALEAARRALAEVREGLVRKEALSVEKRAFFNRLISESGFDDRETWAEARMDDGAYEAAERAVSERRDARTSLLARESSHRSALSLHGQRRPEEAVLSAEEVAGKLDSVRKALEEASGRLGELEGLVKRNREDEARRKEAYEALVAARATLEKWKNLNRWLGGMDGKNFRVYAQGRTLDRLLRAATPHLATMSDNRYGFQWTPGSGTLEPRIVDHYLGDEVRCISNLSGGETFMVSLALTLGLSHLSGDHFSVGSLFLDEGFGTLDQSSLQLALDMLSKLHSRGCLVGIISHVEAVKEFIPDRIEIRRIGPGAGAVVGVGVTTGPARPFR